MLFWKTRRKIGWSKFAYVVQILLPLIFYLSVDFVSFLDKISQLSLIAWSVPVISLSVSSWENGLWPHLAPLHFYINI